MGEREVCWHSVLKDQSMQVWKSNGERTQPNIIPVFTGEKLYTPLPHFTVFQSQSRGQLIDQEVLQDSHGITRDSRVPHDAPNEMPS